MISNIRKKKQHKNTSERDSNHNRSMAGRCLCEQHYIHGSESSFGLSLHHTRFKSIKRFLSISLVS